MGNLLFSPIGRIGAQDFKLGAVILLIANVLFWMSWKVSISAGTLCFFLSFVTLYSWACLYIKRLHDAGKSGSLFLPIFVGYSAIAYILSSILMVGVVTPDMLEDIQNLQKSMNMQNPDPEQIQRVADMIGVMALPFAVGYLMVGAAFAYGANALLIHDPNDNQYGPA